MAPIEDLQSRDLAWISDFVMQQMVIMLRPMMDQLQQTDMTADYAQRAVQRISVDVSELRSDIERTNKYLSILRQGLGVQNEGKCILQRGLDTTTRAVKRLDEQMETMFGVMRSVEDNLAQLSCDFGQANSKHQELSDKLTESNSTIEALQAKVERISNDAHMVKDELMNSEAKLEVWQREIRELRRTNLNLGMGSKLEEKSIRGQPSSQSGRGTERDSWQKKSISPAAVEVTSANGGNTPGSYANSVGFGDLTKDTGTSQRSAKRISRVGSSSSRMTLLPEKSLQQEPLGFAHSGRQESRVWSAGEPSELGNESSILNISADEANESSRLPLLGGRQANSLARSTDRTPASDGPRLRFTATMAHHSDGPLA
jgi:peptidoglycan hydrolase CwlO-like protein